MLVLSSSSFSIAALSYITPDDDLKICNSFSSYFHAGSSVLTISINFIKMALLMAVGPAKLLYFYLP
jgi:hypothetical protein